MAILTFGLGALLFVAGGFSLYMSVDLVPTEMGRLYGLSGVMLLSASGGVLAIAALIARLDRIFAPPRKAKPPATAGSAADSTDAAPLAEPEVVARYSAAGANYALYANGVIEAETPDGDVRFASMDEFKTYIASRRG